VPRVIANAAQLPFATASFDAVTSSGMIEHVGVLESSTPYRVRAQPDQTRLRAAVVREPSRLSPYLVVTLRPSHRS
jgi:Methyltransferase domain